nr:hypothetical protein CFP56_57576 [Quercus suber]
MAVTLLDDPAATPLGRRNQLKDMVKMSDDEIKALTPDQIRKVMEKGADLDEAGKPKTKDSSLKIRIELDLEVEVHLTARVQGDITIGLLSRDHADCQQYLGMYQCRCLNNSPSPPPLPTLILFSIFFHFPTLGSLETPPTMVFGIITAVAACPAIIGTTEAVRHGQKKNNREEHRGRKYHLAVTLTRRSRYCEQFDGATIVLKDAKLYVDTRRDAREVHWPATTNYLDYPGERRQVWKKAGYARGEGFVTTINAERFLNWVYVDKDSHEVKYGVREQSEPHLVGPWDCTQVERRLTFAGWEGFIAVQETDGDEMWALYFDCDDDGLTGNGRVGNDGKRMLEVDVWRKEMKRGFDDALNERLERMEQRAELGKDVE